MNNTSNVGIEVPKDIAVWLINCSDEEFAETFVLYWEMREACDMKGETALTSEMMKRAPITEIADHVRDSLSEIINSKEMDPGAWWKTPDEICPEEITGTLGRLLDETDLPSDIQKEVEELYNKASALIA